MFNLPTDTTLAEILSKVDDTPCRNNEFLAQTRFDLARIGHMTEDDYSVFWACMSIYEATHQNFFDAYATLLTIGFFKEYSFSDGIERWVSDHVQHASNGLADTKEYYLQLVNALRFFDIGNYHGVPFSEFEKNIPRVCELIEIEEKRKNQLHKELSEAGMRKKIDQFFNLGDTYSDARFYQLFEEIQARINKSVTINEALMYAQKADKNATYIVIMKKGSEICHIGKTTNLFAYIGAVQKRKNADAAGIAVADEEYVDDIIIALRVLFEFELDKICISAANRKYTTLNHAVFAYKTDGVRKKEIISAIKNAQIRTVDLFNGQTLVDKVKLLNAVNNYCSSATNTYYA